MGWLEKFESKQEAMDVVRSMNKELEGCNSISEKINAIEKAILQLGEDNEKIIESLNVKIGYLKSKKEKLQKDIFILNEKYIEKQNKPTSYLESLELLLEIQRLEKEIGNKIALEIHDKQKLDENKIKEIEKRATQEDEWTIRGNLMVRIAPKANIYNEEIEDLRNKAEEESIAIIRKAETVTDLEQRLHILNEEGKEYIQAGAGKKIIERINSTEQEIEHKKDGDYGIFEDRDKYGINNFEVSDDEILTSSYYDDEER